MNFKQMHFILRCTPPLILALAFLACSGQNAEERYVDIGGFKLSLIPKTAVNRCTARAVDATECDAREMR